MSSEALTPDEIDDLARRAQRGDRDALEALLTAVRPRVLNVCRGVLPHLPDAEDACQDALLNIANKIGSWGGRGRFTTWMHVVAVNSARSTYRRMKHQATAADPQEVGPLERPDPRTTSVIAGTRLDLLEDGRVAHTVATSERGYARLHLTAVTRSDERADTGDHATRRLNEALTAVLARGFPPRLTRPTLDTLEAASEGAGFPRSLVFRTTPLARVFLLQEWALRPPTQPLVRDEVVVTQVTSGLAGGQGAADRGHAVLEARLLPGTTPGRMRDLLRARIKDPDVHLVVEDGANWSGSKADPQVLLRIAERAHVPGVSEQVVLPIMNPEPLGARPFRDQEIPVYGFLPYALDEADLARIKGRDERLPLDDYRRGFRVLTGLVIDLTAAPAEKSSRP
ncbi:MAG: hypothetical protein KC621_09640 [Myxococcales bacterium]|nr:hypothetical protein [Myxococcales bacterium]